MYKRNPIKVIRRYFIRNFSGQKGVSCHIQSAERSKFPTKNTLFSKVIIQNSRRDSFPEKEKLKEFITTKPAL